MKLKAGMIVDAFTVLTTIINEKRPMTPKAGYRIARLHDKLERDSKLIMAAHDKLVIELGEEVMVNPPKSATNPHGHGDMVPSGHYKVKDANLPEYQTRWAEIANDEIEVDVEPIPLECFGDKAGLLPNEFKLLGPLVAE